MREDTTDDGFPVAAGDGERAEIGEQKDDNGKTGEEVIVTSDVSGYQRKLALLRKLDTAKLAVEDTDQRGEAILGGGGTLLRKPDLENVPVVIDVDLITENPENPRTDFNEKELRKTANSIACSGLDTEPRVVPYVTNDGRMRFLLVDGARRLRSVRDKLGQREIPVRIEWHETSRDIFTASVRANFHRQQHNPVEFGRAI